MKPIQIFRAGRHTAMSGQTFEFSETDLQAAAAAYDPALSQAPIVVGHPQHDAPAYGWVSALDYAEDGLHAKPDQVDEAFAEMVRKGRFKHVSASFYTPTSPSNPKPGVYYLRHVGFLGAQPPAVKGLKPVEFGQHAEGVIEFAELDFAEGEEGLFQRFLAWMRGREQPSQSTETQTADMAEEPNTMTPEQIAAKERELQAQKDGLDRQKAEQEAAFAERERKLAEQATKARREADAKFAEALVTAGKVLPRERDGLIAFMAGLPDNAVVEFGEGDARVKQPARAWLTEFLKALPKRVDYAERSADDGTGADDQTADAETTARKIADFVESERKAGRIVSYTQAAAHIAKQGASR